MAAGAPASTGSQYDALVKILLLGNSAVGKTCLLMRFCEQSFDRSFITTIGIDFKIRTVELDGRRVKLQIWDTAGQERFRTITQAYYRQASSILLVFDVCDQTSFDHIGNWMQSIKQHNTSDELQIVLVGNKVDLANERVVTEASAQALAESYNIRYYECSAKSGQNVEQAFLELAKDQLLAKDKAQAVDNVAVGGGGTESSGCC